VHCRVRDVGENVVCVNVRVESWSVVLELSEFYLFCNIQSRRLFVLEFALHFCTVALDRASERVSVF